MILPRGDSGDETTGRAYSASRSHDQPRPATTDRTRRPGGFGSKSVSTAICSPRMSPELAYWGLLVPHEIACTTSAGAHLGNASAHSLPESPTATVAYGCEAASTSRLSPLKLLQTTTCGQLRPNAQLDASILPALREILLLSRLPALQFECAALR